MVKMYQPPYLLSYSSWLMIDLATSGNCRKNCFCCSKSIFDAHVEDPDYNPLPGERPGGFQWGEGRPAPNNQ